AHCLSFSQNKPARILSPPNQHVGKRITWRYLGTDPRIAPFNAERVGMPRLTLLGSFSMDRGGPVTLRNKKAQALVAFLAMNPGVVHVRERLAALLWPDSHEDAARQSLRQCISMLRHDCAELVTTDVVEFKDAVSDPSIANLKRAAELYRGPFLEGLNARSDLFDEWLLGERTRLRAVATSAFHTLLQELQLIGAREEAIALALRLLAIDPLQEEVDCALMRLYSEQGQTALALRQYKRCEAILRKELNVEPDQETRALYQQLLRHRSQHRGPPGDVAAAEPAASPRQLKQNVRTCTARDGVRIAYASVGAGPPLVKAANWLNHLEFDFASPVWQHWIEALSRDNTFLRYDERGTGLSDWDVFDISFDAFVRDLETVVDAAGLERFPLLGISQGCAISIAYAVKHPERVSHLVLYGGYAKGWRHQDPSNVARREALPTLVLEGWGKKVRCFARYSRPSSFLKQMPSRRSGSTICSGLRRRRRTPSSLRISSAKSMCGICCRMYELRPWCCTLVPTRA
ncbi:alpha/beta hydrolase, partial [Bradyrhizobium liaoningense]|uniref:alpha/beta hydrolase n=1 Tax=Bradyrhizobium liaoningense TaxID=43992 RepID=UPI002012FB76